MIGRLWRGRGCGEDGDGNGRERGGVVVGFFRGGWVVFVGVVVVFWGLRGLACEDGLNHLLRERF